MTKYVKLLAPDLTPDYSDLIEEGIREHGLDERLVWRYVVRKKGYWTPESLYAAVQDAIILEEILDKV